MIPPLTDSTASIFDYFIRSAWAHGEGHLDAGRVVGEVLGQVSFDALSSELVSFRTAVTSAKNRFGPWIFGSSREPGVAVDTTKIDTIRPRTSRVSRRAPAKAFAFAASSYSMTIGSPIRTVGQRGNQSITGIRQVRGVPTSFFPVEGGQLQIQFDVTRLFRGADFSSLKSNPTDADGTKALVQKQTSTSNRDQVMTNLYQGLRETGGTYSVRWVAP